MIKYIITISKVSNNIEEIMEINLFNVVLDLSFRLR